MPFISDFSEVKNLPVGSFVRTVKGKELADFIYIASSTSVSTSSLPAAASSSSSSQRKTVFFINAFYPTPQSLEAMDRDRHHSFSKQGAIEAHRELPADSFDLYFVLCVPDYFFGRIAYPSTTGVPPSALNRFSMFQMSLPLVGGRTPAAEEDHGHGRGRRRGAKRKVDAEGHFVLL